MIIGAVFRPSIRSENLQAIPMWIDENYEFVSFGTMTPHDVGWVMKWSSRKQEIEFVPFMEVDPHNFLSLFKEVYYPDKDDERGRWIFSFDTLTLALFKEHEDQIDLAIVSINEQVQARLDNIKGKP